MAASIPVHRDLAIRAFRAILSLYPGEFCDEYGREMALVFADRWRDTTGFWERAGVAAEALRGVAVEAPQEHIRILSADLKHANRSLRETPTVTLTIIATLALAVGINLTMLGLLDRLLLRPVAGVADPERVVRVYGHGYWTALTRSWPDYLDLRDGTRTLASVAAFQRDRAPLRGARGTHSVIVERVTPGYFSMLGVSPERGRFFSLEEDSGEDGAIAVLSHAVWQREFAGDENVYGRVVQLGGRNYTVIGVAPSSFAGVDPEAVAVWLPLGELRRDRGNYGAVHVIARLRPDVPLAAAEQDANNANRRGWLADGVRQGDDLMRLGALSLTQGPAAPKEVKVAVWLAAIAGIVLLIGVANVTQLLLARALAQRRESGVRLALGASRIRLMRQWWAESMLLAVLGGVAALAVTFVAAPLAQSLLLPAETIASPSVDLRVLLGTSTIVLAAGLFCGAVPAWQAGRWDVISTLKPGHSRIASHPKWVREILVIGQVALTVTLLAGAGLFVRSLLEVHSLSPGFAMDRLIVVHVDAQAAKLDNTRAQALLERMASRVRELPGVQAAGLSHTVPFESAWRTRFYVLGRETERWGEEGGGRFNRLSTFLQPEALSALGIRLVEGRSFVPSDRAGTGHVALVNEQFAREVWPAAKAVGQCFQTMKPTAPCTEVVGVVEDTRVENLFDKPPAQYYLPLAQPVRGEVASALLVRVADSPEHVAGTIQRELQAMLPDPDVVEARPMSATIEPVVRPWRLGASVLTAFGALALAISAVGLFGLLSHTMAERMHELNVRKALGARPWDIGRLVGGRLLRIVAPGTVLGLAGALLASRWIAGLLYGIGKTDPTSYACAVLIVICTACATSVGPIVRVLRMDPVLALRQE